MRSGTRLVLVFLAAAAGVALLRGLCVPVGSFRAGLDELRWGMPADSVVAVLGRPNRICVSAEVGHVGSAPGADRATLRAATAERWIYSDRPPPDDPPRIAAPGCRPPPAAAELGLDDHGRLRWLVRESLQTPVEVDPSLTVRRQGTSFSDQS